MRESFKKKVILELIQMAGQQVDELPIEAWQTFRLLRYSQLVIPLILRDKRNGLTQGQMRIKYGLSEKQVRLIVENDTKGRVHA